MKSENIKCPFCSSRNTSKKADFSTALMVKLHYCNECHSYFEAIKWGVDPSELDLPDFLKK